MGVKNAWKFIKRSGSPFTSLSTMHEIQQYGTHIHVDVLGTFQELFIKHFSPYEKGFQNNRESCLSFLQQLSCYLDKRSCTLYLDGFDITSEKCISKSNTENRKELNKQKVINLIKKVESTTSNNSNHSIDFIKYSQTKKIEWLLKKTVTITNEMKQCFLQISNEQGWNTVMSSGISTIAIAKVANGKTIVLSNNSDLIFHTGIASVIKSSKGKFKMYDITDILHTLNLSCTALTALAIISGNDYDNQVLGFDIYKNYKWILKSKNLNLELKGTFIKPNDYVDEYVNSLKYTGVLEPYNDYFLDSVMIFVLLFENIQDDETKVDCDEACNEFEKTIQIWKSQNKTKSLKQYIFCKKKNPVISLPLERGE